MTRCSGAVRLALLEAIGAACVGTIDPGEPLSSVERPPSAARRDESSRVPGAPPPSDAQTIAREDGVAPAYIRRLTRRELGNAVEALVGLRPARLEQLPDDANHHSFDRVVQGQTISLAHLEVFDSIADEISDWLTPARLGALVRACAGAPSGADGLALARSRRPCVEKVVDELGPPAFRGPVAPEYRAALLALYDGARTYADGLRQVVHGLFMAPEFLYVVERGKPLAARPGVFALTDEEIATRLSLFLCETIPDSELLAAARAGQLNEPSQITAQAARLMDQPCAQRTVARFFTQWLRADKVFTAERDPKLFPQFTRQARAAMVREQEEFVRQITWSLNGGLPDLFTASFTFIDRDLASIYGLTWVAAAAPARVELPAHRRGVLTQPAFLTATTPSNVTSPVVRGVFVLRDLLCQELPIPDVVPPLKDDGQASARQLAEKHAADPRCAVCHNIIDPVGFALEDFDAVGRYRANDRGVAVDAVGGIPSLGIATGTVRGGAGLSTALAGRGELRACFARQLFRFGLARLEGEQDSPSLRELMERLGADRTRLKDAVIGLVRTYAFRHRAVGP